MTESFPPDFLALPEATQRQILLSLRETVRLAADRAVPIIVSAPPSAGDLGDLRSASGSFVRVGATTYLATAWHVWAHFRQRVDDGDHVILQAGKLSIPSDGAGRIEDRSRDVVFFPVPTKSVERSGEVVSSAALGWPPPSPKVGSFVLFSGYPEYLRERGAVDHVGFATVTSLMRVTDTSDTSLICQFERDTWIWDERHPPAPPGADLSGMSGGPVFSTAGLAMPLVGVIKRFGATWEVLHVGLFAGMPWPSR